MGVDAWVMRRASQSADEYACEWIETNTDDPAEFARRFDEWMATYDELGIAAIGFGLATMRRREGTNWFRIDDAPETLGFPAGDDITRLFDRADVLAFADDASLMEVCFRLPAEVQLVQECRPGRDQWDVTSALVRRTGGLGYSGTIDPAGARLLARCDGHRSLRTLLAEIAAETDVSVNDVAESSVAIVRRLVERACWNRSEAQNFLLAFRSQRATSGAPDVPFAPVDVNSTLISEKLNDTESCGTSLLPLSWKLEMSTSVNVIFRNSTGALP